MKKVIVTSNEKQQHVTEGGNQLNISSFVAKLGIYGEGNDINTVLNGSFNFPQDTSVDTKDFTESCTKINVIDSLPVEINIKSR